VPSRKQHSVASRRLAFNQPPRFPYLLPHSKAPPPPLTLLHLAHRIHQPGHVPLQPGDGGLVAEHRLLQRAHLRAGGGRCGGNARGGQGAAVRWTAVVGGRWGRGVDGVGGWMLGSTVAMKRESLHKYENNSRTASHTQMRQPTCQTKSAAKAGAIHRVQSGRFDCRPPPAVVGWDVGRC